MIVPTLLFCAVALALGYLFSPPEPELVAKLQDSTAAKEAYAALPPMAFDEWKVMGGFILAVVLWVFGANIGLDPGFAALIVMGLLFLPKVGVLEAPALKQLNWDIVLLVGAIVGVAGILDQSGVLSWLSKVLVAPILGPLAGWGLIGIAIGCVIVGIIAHFLLPGPTNLTLALPLLLTWGMSALSPAATFAFLGMLSELNDKNILFPYWLPPYYVYLAQDVTDIPRFNVLLARIFPFTTVATIVGAFVIYGIANATGIGIR
jgi:di/tricarboxylate transporter